MALNDHFRIIKGQGPDRIEIHMPSGTVQLDLRQGYLILPPGPADPQTAEIGSIWYDDASGTVMVKVAAGAQSVVTAP